MEHVGTTGNRSRGRARDPSAATWRSLQVRVAALEATESVPFQDPRSGIAPRRVLIGVVCLIQLAILGLLIVLGVTQNTESQRIAQGVESEEAEGASPNNIPSAKPASEPAPSPEVKIQTAAEEDAAPGEAPPTLKDHLPEVGTRLDFDLEDHSIFFQTESAVLASQSLEGLDTIATYLREHPAILVLQIEGHTDSRGDAAFNKILSQRRAETVRRELVDRGVATKRLKAIGYGEERPLVAGRSSEAHRQNRRVDFVVSEVQN